MMLRRHSRSSERRRQWRSRHYERPGREFFQEEEEDHRRQRRRDQDDDLCAVCHKTTYTPTIVCSSCNTSHAQSYSVWKTWMLREQQEYQKRLGCTHSNSMLFGAGTYVQRTCIVHPELLLIKRVKACIGWAIHGLVFEFWDGSRTGHVLDLPSIDNDAAIQKKRATEWQDIQLGDYITGVYGYHLSRGCFLCHSLVFVLSSKRTISFLSQHDPWKGDYFEYTLPENSLLHHVSFKKGSCVGLTAAETILHLSIQSPLRVKSLDVVLQKTFGLLQLVARRIDNTRSQQGKRPLGRDLWATILFEYLACHDLLPFTCSPIAKLQQHKS